MGNLIENTPNRPYVHSGVINLSSEQDLWGSIPKGDDLVGVLFDWIVVGSGEAKICQLYVQAFAIVYQYILWFEVSVDDTIGMTVL